MHTMPSPNPSGCRSRRWLPVVLLAGMLSLGGCASFNQAFDDNYSQELNNKGFRLLKQQDYVHARPIFLHALRLSPHNQEARINLGLCYQALGRTADARKQYLEVIQYEKIQGDTTQVTTSEGVRATILDVARSNLLTLEDNPHMVPEVGEGVPRASIRH